MRIRRIAILVVAAVLLVSACGSDDDSGTTDTTKAGSANAGGNPSGGTDTATDAAKALYAAWKADDKKAAAEVADQTAIDSLFAESFTGPDQTFYGCGGEKVSFTCVYYDDEGGYQYAVKGSDSGGYRVATIKKVAPKG
ncbi:MAG: hypothetical protein WKF43_09895 [Acidimicrobiales bacterium]